MGRPRPLNRMHYAAYMSIQFVKQDVTKTKNLKMNPVLLRKQLKDNASDLQDFCKDLKSWGEEMKKKEESLKNKDNENMGSNSKVRKIAKGEKKAPRKEAKLKKPVTKIGVTDYAAWDKFDADAECEKLEDTNEDSELTDECNDGMRDEALVEKEKGNKHVKNQNWDEAIKCYSKAIECYSYDPIFFANRALCYLKKGNFKEAENDCTLSLKLDSTYVKAYQRRAAAREGLNKLDHAEFDLSKVLELEPKNKESISSLENLRKKLGKTEQPTEHRPVSKFTATRGKSNINYQPSTTQFMSLPKPDSNITETNKVIDTSKSVPTWPKEDNIILVKPIKKPPHLRSQKPLKRIDIIEVDNCKNKINKVEVTEPVAPEAVKKHVFEKKEIENVVEDPPEVVSVFKKKQQEKDLKKANYSSAWPRPDQQIDCLKSDDFKVIEKQNPEIYINKPLNISKELKNTSNINISSNENKKFIESESSTDFIIPKTSVQFYLTWKNLKSTEEKYKYLKMIPPQNLPKIFLDSLESNVFSNILEVLVKHFIENKDCVFNILDYLTQVKRFGTFTIFMSSSDKNNLWKLFDYIKETEQKNKEEVDRLIQKYEL